MFRRRPATSELIMPRHAWSARAAAWAALACETRSSRIDSLRGPLGLGLLVVVALGSGCATTGLTAANGEGAWFGANVVTPGVVAHSDAQLQQRSRILLTAAPAGSSAPAGDWNQWIATRNDARLGVGGGAAADDSVRSAGVILDERLWISNGRPLEWTRQRTRSVTISPWH